jgi:hypothetical protein
MRKCEGKSNANCSHSAALLGIRLSVSSADISMLGSDLQINEETFYGRYVIGWLGI